MRTLLRRLALLVGFATPAGCATDGRGSGQAYQLDISRIGTGEQAVVPLDDATHWNGVPLDTRRK